MSQESGQLQNEEINYKLDHLATSQREILTLLKGQPLNPHDKGILGNVHDINSRVGKIENNFNRVKWVAFGLTLPAAYGIVTIVVTIVKQYIKHP